MADPSLVAMSPQDELLRLTGSAGNPFETVTATGNGTGRYIGANRRIRLRPVVAGTVSGTNPTLDVKLQDSADGVTYADMGISFDQLTATQNTVVGNLSPFPERDVKMADGRPYLRIVKTIGGTASPSFGNFAILHEAPIPW
jgi:hypothetical protein